MGFGVVVDGSDIDERVLPMGPKVVEIGANVLSLAVVDLDVVAMLESGVTDSACTASSVVLLGWSEFSETSSVWIILACAELVPSGVPASVDADIYVDHELINNSIDISCPWAEQETIPTKGDFQFRLGSRTTQPTGIEADIYVDHSLIINSIDI